jgi:hypothetical protein
MISNSGIKAFGCNDPAHGNIWIPIKVDSNGVLQVNDPPPRSK